MLLQPKARLVNPSSNSQFPINPSSVASAVGIWGIQAAFHQILVSPQIGGAGLIALQLAKALRARTPQSHVWIPGDGPARKQAEVWKLVDHDYDLRASSSNRKFEPAIANLKIAYRLRSMGPGIVHVHGPYAYGALRLGLKVSGLKRVAHVQIDEVENGLRWAFKYPPDVIVTCARFLVENVRRSLAARHQDRQRIVAVPNAVDTTIFYPGRRIEAKVRIGAPPDVPLILMLANLAPHKGQETVIRTIALLKQRGVNALVWFAGIEREGGRTYTDHLLKLAGALEVTEQIKFLGYCEDSARLLRGADVFLLPSTREGLPLSILEAQASKVPVLAAPTPGACEVITHGETGFLIAHDHAEGYADYVLRLLTKPALYHRVTENAYERVRSEYDWKTYCERTWQIYRELLDGCVDASSSRPMRNEATRPSKAGIQL